MAKLQTTAAAPKLCFTRGFRLQPEGIERGILPLSILTRVVQHHQEQL